MILLRVPEQFQQQVAGRVVPDLFAQGDGLPQLGNHPVLEAQVVTEDFRHIAPDVQRLPLIQAGDLAEKQDAAYQRVGMSLFLLHFMGEMFMEPGQAPFPAQPAMEEILVDGGQLAGQQMIERGDDIGMALHCGISCKEGLRPG